MKLAIFWSDLLHYHIARLRALFSLADKKGHEIFAFSLTSKSPEIPMSGYHNLLKDRIRVLCNDPKVAGPYSHISKQQLVEALSKYDPDAVAIIGYDGKVSRAALGWCRAHHKGAILMLAGQEKDAPRFFWKELPKKWLLSCYDSVLAGGKTHVDYALKLGMPRERILTGYNVVDNNFWIQWSNRVREQPAQWRKKYKLPEKYFLAVGRYIPKKNFTGLINAYAKYATRCISKPWSLVIVGDGVPRPVLESMVDTLKLRERVLLPKYLPADELGPVYGLASAFILPSAFFEQWGLVVNEAMAARLPTLVSNICGCAPDLIQEGKTGFSFNPDDEAGLVQLLLQVSNESFNLEEVGHNAQAWVSEKYSPEVFAENLLTAANIAISHAASRKWQFYLPPKWWL